VRITCSVPDLATRANAGIAPMPSATIAVVVPAPNAAPNTIASSRPGNASSTSDPRMRSVPGHPPRMPATTPTGTPTTAAIPTATIPT
jgi:hypothetical protein